MKQGTQLHPKFKSLAKVLDLRQYEAVGILESIWMMACQFAGEDGNLSRFTRKQIAEWMDWDGDPERLINGLIDCGWLDSVNGSLTIHDWNDHRPHYLKDRSRKKQLSTSSGKATGDSRKFPETPGSSWKAPRTSEPSLVQSSPTQSSQESKGTGKRFSPPSLDEVQEYTQANNYNVDPEKFVSYFESVGWVVGNGKAMKDWRAAIRNWDKSEQKQVGKTLKPQTTNAIEYVN